MIPRIIKRDTCRVGIQYPLGDTRRVFSLPQISFTEDIYQSKWNDRWYFLACSGNQYWKPFEQRSVYISKLSEKLSEEKIINRISIRAVNNNAFEN